MAGKWEEAYRLAKGHAAVSSEHKVLYDWCKSLGAESALKLLKKLNMFEQIIDYALKIQWVLCSMPCGVDGLVVCLVVVGGFCAYIQNECEKR